MLFEKLLKQFNDSYSDRNIVVKDASNKTLTILPDHPDFGEVDIVDDGHEITLIAGNFTHGHFSCYDNGLSVEEREKEIVDDTLDFLEAMFNDKVVFWGRHKSMGGWYRLDASGDSINTEHGDNQFVWSGPVKAA